MAPPPAAAVDLQWSSAAAPPKAEPAVTVIQKPIPDDSELLLVDELLRSRARSHPDTVVMAYPSSGIEYVEYTLQQLDVFTYRVACHLQATIPSRRSTAEPRTVVAVLGPSNLEYLITMQALIKLGHTVLFLSTRIPAPAIASLVKSTNAKFMLADGKFAETAREVQAGLPGLQLMDMPNRSIFEFPVEVYVDTQLDAALDRNAQADETVYIIHSSGSTGFPKPIFQKQRAALTNYMNNMNMKAFITLPLYHNHGICNWYRAIWSRKSIHLWNTDLPLTSDYLVRIMRANRFEIFYGVPYALKLLAEADEGLDLLAAMQMVMYGGSACPDDLGDLLVNHGVNLVSHYGATEVGQLMTSFRPAGDKAWNYVREFPKVAPFLKWLPQGPNLYECCVLPGWPGLTATNRDDGSYHTKDLFEPHPTTPGAWKYVARLDDTLVLVNGEKFNPVVTEGKIRSSRLVAEAVIFGAQQPYLGVLVVPSAATESLKDNKAAVLDELWPAIDAAQRDNDAFAKLSRNMVVVLDHGTDYPRTDKGSVIRQAFYKAFARQIDAAYEAASASSADARVMAEDELRAFLRAELKESLAQISSSNKGNGNASIEFDDDTDLFGLGLDSLQGIQIRSKILSHVRTDAKISQNIVFENPSVAKLSDYLLCKTADAAAAASAADGGAAGPAIEDEMAALVSKYTSDLPVPATKQQSTGPLPPPGRFVAVTGATGSLGAHVASQLARDPSVSRVYCLVRARDKPSGLARVVDSMVQRKVYHSLSLAQRRKLVALPSDLSRRDLGLSGGDYAELASSLRSVVHAAWSVNFNLRLSSFERDNIAGVRNLIALCQAGRKATDTEAEAEAGDGVLIPDNMAAFNFCSSVSAVARYPDAELGPVPESRAEFAHAQGMGYAQSKSVSEAICAEAAESLCGGGIGGSTGGIPVRVLRVGQIVADTVHGLWNATEAVPLMMQSALTVGALPTLSETPSWLPVDVVAKGVAEISLSEEEAEGGASSSGGAKATFANLTNHRTFSWTRDLLPALRAAGLEFDEVSPREWIRRLRASDPDPVANPPIKLVEFFASKYDKADDEFGPSKTYETAAARRLSPALEAAPLLDEGFVRRFVGAFMRGAWGEAAVHAAANKKKKKNNNNKENKDKKEEEEEEEEDDQSNKTVIIVAGPCGSGKTTLAASLAASLGGGGDCGDAPLPFIEGDSLHTRRAVESMRSGRPLTDADREPWLRRVARRAGEELHELGHPAVVVSCSALRRGYRDVLRGKGDNDSDRPRPRTVILDLQCGAETLRARTGRREGHYMKADMVEAQVAAHEPVGEDEDDVFPLDGERSQDEILEEARAVLGKLLGLGL